MIELGIVDVEHIKVTVKHDSSIMAWGCFSYYGVGDIHAIEDKMVANNYIRILKNHMVPSATRLIGRKYIFQHDNDPKHTANCVKDYLAQKKIKVKSIFICKI